MKFKISLLILLLTGFLNIFAQEPTMVNGQVIDAKSNETIPLVNIGIEGTLIGSASNVDGKFSFKVPKENLQDKLYFSAIGYQNLTIPVSQFLLMHEPVQLQPLSYGIDDIEISTRSKVLYRIVRDAAKAIPVEFIHQPYSCQALYQNEEYTNQVLSKKRDAMALILDETGYTSNLNAFQSINYKFLNVQRNFEVKSLSDGTTLMDELLSFDLARTPGNILETAYLNDYDLDLVGESTIGQDSVWIIGYRLDKPSISHTGDIRAQMCEGKLYISKEKNALLKAEVHTQVPVQSRNGRTVIAEKNKAITNVDYRFTTTYKSTDKGYILDRIALNKSFVDEKNQSSKQLASLLIVEINTSNPEKVVKRQYFENMLSDPDFWSGQ